MRQYTQTATPQAARILITMAMVGLAALSVILNALPLAPASDMRWVPSFTLILIFYWAVHQPDVFPRWLAFVTGLFQDLLSGGPIGLWALTYLCVYEGVYMNRLFFVGRAAYSSLLGFMLAAAAAGLLAWLIASVKFWQVLSPLPIAGQTVVTILVYPLLAAGLGLINRAMGPEV